MRLLLLLALLLSVACTLPQFQKDSLTAILYGSFIQVSRKTVGRLRSPSKNLLGMESS